MAGKHKPEGIIGKLRKAEILLEQGGNVADGYRRIGVSASPSRVLPMNMDQARRMKELEKENSRSRRTYRT